MDEDDRQAWVHGVMGTFFGDANLDGRFDTTDLVEVFRAGEYDDDIDGNSTWSTGDCNGDGEFDSLDLVVAFSDGGYELGPRSELVLVPEPTSLAPLVAGLIVLINVSRTRGKPVRFLICRN